MKKAWLVASPTDEGVRFLVQGDTEFTAIDRLADYQGWTLEEKSNFLERGIGVVEAKKPETIALAGPIPIRVRLKSEVKPEPPKPKPRKEGIRKLKI